MSDQPRRPPIDSALRTRVLMGGAFLGALIALALSWMFSWVPENPQVAAQRQAEEKAQQVAKAREEAFRSPPGSCLQWTDSDASDVTRVSCDDDHLFEVVGLADLSSEHGPQAALPDEEAWRELTEEHCGPLAEDYLDKPLDPVGKLSIGVLRPDEKQWSEGDRALHCGLQRVGPGGGLQVLSEPAADLNQSNVWQEGTCLGLVDKGVGDPASCDDQHSYEIVGLVDLGKKFDSYPSEEKQSEWLEPKCAGLVKDYTGGRKVDELAKEGLILTWDTRAQESWEAGSTYVNCKVGAVLEDDSGLAPVQGSVKDSKEDDKDGADKDGDSEKDGESDGDSGGDGGDGDSGDGGGDNSDNSGEQGGEPGNGDPPASETPVEQGPGGDEQGNR